MGTKFCSKCQEAKPFECFSKLSESRDGFNWHCRSCVEEYRQRWRASAEASSEEKKCSRCNTTKPIANFGKDKHSKTGRNAKCKACVNIVSVISRSKKDPEERKRKYREYDAKRAEARKVYREGKRQERRLYNAKWQKENPEKYRERQRRWTSKNRDKINENFRAYRRKRLGYFKIKNQKWAENNPEKHRQGRIVRMQRRRSRVANAEGSFTPQDIRQMLIEQSEKCFTCGTDISRSFTVDHITPLALGGNNYLSNIQILCQSCNSSKGAKTPLQWFKDTGKRSKGLEIDHEHQERDEIAPI